MAPKKAKARSAVSIPKSTSPASDSAKPEFAGFFPFARYVSVVGVHTSLLAFVALFLPRTSLSLHQNASLPFLEALTRSPVLTLAWLCAGVVPLQGWWAGWLRKWWIEYSIEGTDVEKKLERKQRDKGKFVKLQNAWLMTIATSFMMHTVIVLFGAPLLSHHVHTYLLACLVSILTVFTPAYTLGMPSFASDSVSLVTRHTWTRLFAELSPRTPLERALVYPVVGTAVGAWSGAIPIALDWDRPWQAWPLTPALGAITGYLIGSIGALMVTVVLLAYEDVRSAQKVKASKAQ